MAIRNGSQDDRLDLTTRVHLLELIELRAKQWRHTDSMDVYYMQKLSHLDNVSKTASYSFIYIHATKIIIEIHKNVRVIIFNENKARY